MHCSFAAVLMLVPEGLINQLARLLVSACTAISMNFFTFSKRVCSCLGSANYRPVTESKTEFQSPKQWLRDGFRPGRFTRLAVCSFMLSWAMMGGRSQAEDQINNIPASWQSEAAAIFTPEMESNSELQLAPEVQQVSVEYPIVGADIVGAGTGHDSTMDFQASIDALQTQLAKQESQIRRLTAGSGHAAASARDGRIFATFESVLVQPVQSNGTGVIVETDDGYSHVAFPWTISHSPRVSLGQESSPNSMGWRLRMWEFRHSQGFAANDTNGLIPIGNEATAGYFIENGDMLTGVSLLTEGTFMSQIRADVIDLEFQKQITAPFDIYAGLRYGRVSQGYQAATDEGNVKAQSEFRGIGPTVAMRVTHRLPLERLELFSNLRGSMLFGAKDFIATDDVPGNVGQFSGQLDLRSGDDFADSLVTNAELQIGIRYTIRKYCTLSVAMEAQHFGNVGGPNPTAAFAGVDGGITGDSPLDDSLSFLGLSVQSEFLW